MSLPRTALVCATLMEVHYVARFLNHVSMMEMSHVQTPEYNEKDDSIKTAMNDAYEISLHCDCVRPF